MSFDYRVSDCNPGNIHPVEFLICLNRDMFIRKNWDLLNAREEKYMSYVQKLKCLLCETEYDSGEVRYNCPNIIYFVINIILLYYSALIFIKFFLKYNNRTEFDFHYLQNTAIFAIESTNLRWVDDSGRI